MLYRCLHIKTDFAEEWQKDLFDQHMCDLGVDTIDAGSSPEQGGADYYIPSDLWQQHQGEIREYLSSFNFPFSVSEVPDENWNAVWESEHPVQELPLGVRIVPHCAFGAGYHETTSMMIEHLLETDLTGKRVLDNGCGTGVLGIFAKKRGAEEVTAIDIDDKSVENTLENAALNGVRIDARLGDLSAFDFRPSALSEAVFRLSSFDLIIANIHRNILLAQMPLYARLLCREGELWISGFYETDCPALLAAAEEQGLQYLETREKGEWRMMLFRHP
ncbi:MAG: 50S ribosomal protein L11 methyltransferase [Paludibacteraceae bacterium]|nr:50S ribosomal protein L11 methyltransferase [Paludibacteraceae bacterium]